MFTKSHLHVTILCAYIRDYKNRRNKCALQTRMFYIWYPTMQHIIALHITSASLDPADSRRLPANSRRLSQRKKPQCGGRVPWGDSRQAVLGPNIWYSSQIPQKTTVPLPLQFSCPRDGTFWARSRRSIVRVRNSFYFLFTFLFLMHTYCLKLFVAPSTPMIHMPDIYNSP